mmetsp:Transcript_9113/g.29308  ORF Transcript_9113/g.29308 Transcript_9113/m.29308 type:complete len:273 (-) Transcript_9113:264-1082(-)
MEEADSLRDALRCGELRALVLAGGPLPHVAARVEGRLHADEAVLEEGALHLDDTRMAAEGENARCCDHSAHSLILFELSELEHLERRNSVHPAQPRTPHVGLARGDRVDERRRHPVALEGVTALVALAHEQLRLVQQQLHLEPIALLLANGLFEPETVDEALRTLPQVGKASPFSDGFGGSLSLSGGGCAPYLPLGSGGLRAESLDGRDEGVAPAAQTLVRALLLLDRLLHRAGGRVSLSKVPLDLFELGRLLVEAVCCLFLLLNDSLDLGQ